MIPDLEHDYRQAEIDEKLAEAEEERATARSVDANTQINKDQNLRNQQKHEAELEWEKSCLIAHCLFCLVLCVGFVFVFLFTVKSAGEWFGKAPQVSMGGCVVNFDGKIVCR